MVLALERFDGQLSYTEIMNMDVPRLNGLLAARSKFLEERQERMQADMKNPGGG